MQIQEDSPRVHNPLATLEEDYELSVLHLAWEERDGTDERRLLFGMVELLPIEVPPPLDDGLQHTALEGGSAVRIYVRRVVVSAKRALSWYLDCRRGLCVVPTDAGELLDPEQGAVRFKLADLGEEPPWPTLVCISGESPTTPFCPAWHKSPRVHHLIPLSEQGPSRLWLKERMRAHATQWLSERLHFKLDDYPEYWGSIHLVAPNPVFRDLNMRLLKGTPPRESVLVHIETRAGKAVKGLRLTFRDRKPWGPVEVRHVQVNSPWIRFDFERETEVLNAEIVDDQRGTLLYHAGGYLIARGVSINAHFGTGTVRVRGTADDEHYEVSRTSAAAMKSGTTQTLSARSRMFEADSARKKRQEAADLDQHWFSEEGQRAGDALRSRTVGAQDLVFFIDALFGWKELRSFAPAISKEQVPVRILCSSGSLQAPENRSNGTLTRGQALLQILHQIREQLPKTPIEIRAMLGEPPPIQDVFLRVDNQLWILGSSFQRFGERGSLLAKVSDPSPILEHIQKVWEDAVELSRWVEGTKSHKSERMGVGT